MKVNELRIGNFVQLNTNITQVDVIDYNQIIATEFGLIELKYIKPIPLTEEWLLKFGFYKNDELFTIEWNEFSFSIFDFDNGKFAINNSFNYVDIIYVHQLQNLYFALTGEELIINN